MRRIFLVASRSFGRLAGQSTTGFAALAFLAALGALFAAGLFSAEGKAVSVSSVWAIAAANAMPLLTSLLTMRLWSDDDNPGRTEIDLVAPVPERTFAAGRFLAAFVATVAVLATSLAVPVLILPHCAPLLASGVSIARILPAFVALCVLGVPLVAFGSLAGVFFRKSAPAAVASFALTCAIPYAAYRALIEWSPLARMKFAESPLDSLIADAADGSFSAGAVAVAFALALFAVFATSKIFAMRRLAGGGRVSLKMSSAVAISCALLSAMLFSMLAYRLDFVIGWTGVSRISEFSARTREILSGTSREVRVTACIRRSSPEFLPVARLLRAISAEARTMAGAGVKCEFVDPRWDPNAATRIMRHGGVEGSLVFESGRRRIVVPVKDVDEGVCASAIQRLSMPAKSDMVVFTVGHGEPAISDSGPSGLSDAVRALKQEGYRVSALFTATSPIPPECSVLAVVGAATPFSSDETLAVGKFLSQGGRLLSTISTGAGSGLRNLLESYGLMAEAAKGSLLTSDGSDIVVSGFGDHAVSKPLDGSAVVFATDAVRIKAAEGAPAKDGGFAFTPLCVAGGGSFAMAAERGSALKSDLAIRPTRMVVIGDPSFLQNSALASRANANRDFFLNSVAWLAGIEVSGSSGIAENVVSARMDRSLRIRFVLLSACMMPIAAALLFASVKLLRRRRR